MSAAARATLALVSIALSAAAFGLWLHVFQVTGSDAALLLGGLRWWTVPVIAALLAAHIALSALRWSRIEVVLGGTPPPFGRAFLTGAWALGLGTFLPGPIANVTCRGISNRLTGASGLRGAVGGGIDQLADIAIALLFAVPATLAFFARSPLLYVAGCAVAAPTGWVACGLVSKLAAGLPAGFARIGLSSRLLCGIYAFTLLRFLNLSAITVMIHFATGAATLGATLISVPLVTLAISAAMLPGGFGVAEWSFTGVFAGLGIPADEITVFVLANRIILTTIGVFFGLVAALLTARSLWRRANAS